ncbi:SAM-dependent DNA methyltransferase [Candidatus Poribacteria bacterium]|nr:SAM-dependent DNA methyltransferase [Candidatus Poribacteria bacterium]
MNKQIGQVFTPLCWAKWLINRWNIIDAWVDGAHICDPTAGQGIFALALLQIAKEKGIPITTERLSRITLIEMVPSLLIHFKRNVQSEFSIDFPTSQIYTQDVITQQHHGQYDLLIGNPPWANFGDLPESYKTLLKPNFIQEGLVDNTQRMLLGSSRIDISALVLKVALGRLLKENGTAYFYLPTSLFFGEGAHRGFRNYSSKSSDEHSHSLRDFAVDTVYEFSTTKVFEGVNTGYCCARFIGDKQQEFPVTYYMETNDDWVEHKAIPLKDSTDPWRIVQNVDELSSVDSFEITISPEQKPRQGVNTCGANSVFIFEEKPKNLPDDFIFPLTTKEIWNSVNSVPNKWILLPYNRDTGKPLSWCQIEKHETLMKYLLSNKERLIERKGTLLRASMSRGNWWAMLGVGPYSFAPYKVIWQAYGKNHFTPIILDNVNGQMWQGNQAMHAFIPCWSKDDAQRIKTCLENPEIPELLRQLNGGGKCNWAQPGKIKKLLSIDNTDQQVSFDFK